MATTTPALAVQKITTFLTFNNEAEEAMNLYVSVFKNARIVSTSRMGEEFLTGTFEIEGQRFMVLNGGPTFSFAQGISLFVNCETQAEVDELWEKLSAGGKEDRCGWLKDKFGVSWQIIPSILGQLLSDPDPQRAQRAMQAMLTMQKIDIAALQQAADNK
jgi:predicted 3-demethylubiquinone-9 3-methyltransferase (glyoxalase superfamily)